MGVLVDNLIALRRYAPPPCRMLEFGNQYLCAGAKPYADFPSHLLGMDPNRPVVAKPYFESLGYAHVSVDLNGKDGALVRDLSAPFDLGCLFDVVTDFGTSEHVKCLWACLENAHRHAKHDGLIFCANPEPGSWPDHGYWYRGEDFNRAFASTVGYELISSTRVACTGNTIDGWLTCAIFRKKSDKFVDKNEFYKLPLSQK